MWWCQYLHMTDVQEQLHKAMQFYDLIESNASGSSDDEEEKEAEVNNIFLQLQQLSTHMHNHVFCNGLVCIYGATPTVLMHAFLLGIIPYMIKIILSPFTNTKKHKLNKSVDKNLITVQYLERTKYLRCSFII